MKIRITFLFFAIVLSSNAQNTWLQMANCPGIARMGASSFSIGTKGYVCAGGDFSSTFFSDVWEYDPILNSWTQKANVPGTGRYRAMAASIGSKGYLCGGYNGTTFNDLYEFDPVANTWTAKASMGMGSLFGGVGMAIGSKFYVGTGTSSGYQKIFWAYDPGTNAWTQKADFGGAAKIYASGLSINGKGYLGLGGEITNIGIGKNDWWEYDTLLNNWTQKANKPGLGLTEANTFTMGDYGYVVIGSNNWGSVCTNQLYQYDPVADSWTALANFPGGNREHGIAFVVDCKAYVGHGFENDNFSTLSNDLWEYTPPAPCGNQPPIAAFFSSDTTICEGACIDFTSTALGAPTLYAWSFPGASTTTSYNANPTSICYNTAGTYDVEFIVCNNVGCDTVLMPGFITVVANPPQVSLTVSGDTIFSNGAFANSWYQVGNVQVLGNGSYYLPNQSGSFYSIICNVNGCCISSDTVQFTVSVLPIVNISSTDTLFCEKQCVDFFDLSQNNPTSWSWTFTNAAPSSSTAQNPIGICFNNYGSYNVTLVACNGAGCDSVTFSSFITSFQNPPKPTITLSNDTLYSSPGVSYAWYEVSNPTVVLSTLPYYVFTQDGNYYVIITDSNGCASAADAYTIHVGLYENNLLQQVQITPNPANDWIKIVLPDGLIQQNTEVRMFDNVGKLVANKKLTDVATLIETKLFAEGIYTIHLEAKGKLYSRKVTIAH
ncbi:MAG: T9SS type A sorting domain-containing protein [Bacteroidetes bacterium]|nr:T9SS type A sorting domain-containing protein [Bacteroidota bacterium]